VTWTNLLANKEAQKHKTSKKELDNMRALIARDLADAGLAGLSADRRFATAYNAALQAANMAIACAGYRIMSKVGHHRVSLESTKLVLGKTHAQVRRLFRNLSAKTKYDRLHLLQRCDGDGSEGDPHQGIPVLQRSRRLGYEESPFTEEVETATVWTGRTLTHRSKSSPVLLFA
jgi:hypothetical protein